MNDEERDDDAPLGLDAWPAEEPPGGFADRVMARIQTDVSRKPARRPVKVARWVAFGGGLALAAAVLLRVVTGAPSRGEAIAKDERQEVALGGRAIAVLAPGASVRWNGDDVEQPKGDVFYRVEPGARFTVHTPAGDVEVRGTCFEVKVSEETTMQKRDLKTGAIGAALSALAFVAVYEGKVSVSHASTHADLKAGESASMGPAGVTKTTSADAFEADLAKAESDDPTMSANKNLVRQLGDYRSRLDAIAQEKTTLEGKLQKTEAALQAAQDGAPVKLKSDFDISADDWRELAKDGTIKYQTPCGSASKPWTPSAEKLNKLGLSAEDGATIKNAYQRSSQHTWDQIRPLCAQALGSEVAADRVGPDTCPMVIVSEAENRDPQAVYAARQLVGQIRGGEKPMPGPNDQVPNVTKLMLAMTGASSGLESDLAQSLGPDEAHRLVYAEDMCFGHHVFGGTPPAPAPATK